MNRTDWKTSKNAGMAAFALTMLILFIFTGGTALRLQAQTEPLASASWSQSGYSATHVGYNPKEKTLSTANVAGLTLAWQFPTSAEVNVPTLVSGNTVFIDSTDGNLYAVNATTGQQIWTFPGTETHDGNGGTAQGMAISGSTIYVDCQIDNNGGGHAGVCALNVATGKMLWSWAIYNDGGPTSSGPYNPPVVSNGVVVLGEADTAAYAIVGYVVGLNAKTGALLWQIGNCSGGALNDCHYITPDAAAVSKGVVYYSAPGQNNFAGVCAVELTSGASLWCSQTGDGGSPVSVSGNTVFANTSNGVVYAFNAKTGAQLWTYNCGGCDRSEVGPAVANGVVYVAGYYYGGIYALSAKSGRLLWSGVPGHDFWSSPSVANGVLYVQCRNACALDASTGALLWASSESYSQTGSSPAVVNGTVYDSCNYNNVCAYKLP